MNILDEIFASKKGEVAARRRARPLEQVRRAASQVPPPLNFLAALRGTPHRPALIAEIKRRSPSRGLLCQDLDPARLASIYRQNGAAAISVLTDGPYFGGLLEDLQTARRRSGLPVLRKDFLCYPYQIYEARAAGADAVLLIAAYLTSARLLELHTLAQALGMAALVEVHDRAELEKALELKPALLGINNRDLRTFLVRLETCLELRQFVPSGVTLVAESGIHFPADVERLAQAEVDAILVGEALVTAADPAAAVRQLARLKARQPTGEERPS